MAVNSKTSASTPKAATPATPAEPAVIKLELVRIKRYMYQGHLYMGGEIYVFNEPDARALMQMTDPQGLPVWTLAKPRTRLVQIPVEARETRVKRVENISMPLEQFVRQQIIEPVGKIDLGDDDPEIAAKLASADSDPELLDTGEGPAVQV